MTKYWALKGVSVETIKKVHSSFGTCSSAQTSNKICEHVHSYLNIINKINQNIGTNKIAIKLPIEKIGTF